MSHRILVGTALIVLLTAGLSTCTVPIPHLGWIEQVERQIREGNYTAAEAIYSRAMQEAPEDAGPALHLAALYADWGRPNRGLDALNEAASRGAVADLMIPLRFNLLIQTGQWSQLRQESQTQISETSTLESAWRALTLATLHQGDCAAATESAIKWASIRRSTREEALVHLAVLSGDPDRLARFAPDLYRAAEMCDGDLAVCIGYALIRQERWALAICPLRRAVRMDPRNPNAHVWLGEVLSRNLMHVEAESHLLTAVRLAPEEPLPWLLLGKHYLELGEIVAARNPLLNAQALDPANPAACLAIAELKAQAGAYEEMGTWANAALERAPDDVEIWKAVARLYLTRHLVQEPYPLRIAEGAIQLEPEDSEAHMLLGWSYLQLGQTQAALEAIERSVALAPESGEAHFRLGQALQAAEKLRQAQAAQTRAANLGYFPDR